jgi:hypothetical protein
MTKIHDIEYDVIVNNITSMYESAVIGEQGHALNWYKRANKECRVIAEFYGLTLECFVGIVAALSPQMNWKYNIREAVSLVTKGYALGYGANVTKARVILAGAPPLDILGGNKVRSFYLNIMDPSCDEVTVDTWALRIAAGDPGYPASGITNKQYARLREAYREVADKVGLVACELQAITWVHIRSQVNLKIGATQLGLPL